MTLYDPTTLRELLRRDGELHAFLEDGGEAHLHRRDVTITDEGVIEIDSAEGSWRLPVALVSGIERPESEYLSPD